MQIVVAPHLEVGANTGVRVEVKGTDSVAGGESKVVYEERLSDGDWEKYKPLDEWQRRFLNLELGYDTYSCMTFSALNIVEMQFAYLVKTGAFTDAQISEMKELGYLNENGEANFNDWFTAVMSGTDENGNSYQDVLDSIRNHGLLPQSEGYQVNDFATRAEYLGTFPSQAQKDKALKIKKYIKLVYEWVVCDLAGANIEIMKKHLKQAPLHILTPTGSNWNTKPPAIISDPGMKTVNHATACIGIGTFIKDLDHYNPFIKNLAIDYYIPYAMKVVVSLQDAQGSEEEPRFEYVFTKQLTYGMGDTEEVRNLQKALQALGYMKKGIFGPFGPQTRTALAKFQADNNIKDNGTNFGPLTRTAINLLINKN